MSVRFIRTAFFFDSFLFSLVRPFLFFSYSSFRFLKRFSFFSFNIFFERHKHLPDLGVLFHFINTIKNSYTKTPEILKLL